MLIALPVGGDQGLQGIMQAIQSGRGTALAARGLGVAAVLVTLTALGSVGAWLASVARIPFVAGIDHYLPEGFGRVHPRYGTPWAALI